MILRNTDADSCLRRSMSQEIVDAQAKAVIARRQVIGNRDEVREKELHARKVDQIDRCSQGLALEQLACGRADFQGRQGQCPISLRRGHATDIFERGINEYRLTLAEPPGIQSHDITEAANLAANLDLWDDQRLVCRRPTF